MSSSARVVQVAIAAPLRRVFDYLPRHNGPAAQPGARVRVDFGRRREIGVVVGETQHSEVRPDRLKNVSEVLDAEPLLSPASLELLIWAADYYHHPIGEVVLSSLPVLLRRGRVAQPGVLRWKLTTEGKLQSPEVFARTPLQRRLFQALTDAPIGLDASQLYRISPGWLRAVKQLSAKGWVWTERRNEPIPPHVELQSAPSLNSPQQAAVQTIAATLGRFGAFLLHGVTGSGKTEVYLHVIAEALNRGNQALVLVPEIALTPQLIRHFQLRFGVPIAVLHSGLNESQRLRAWLAARDASAPIVLGTRSAVFAPIPRLGVVVVDEEHDASYKQQDGFRYSARDVAVMRARRAQVPIVLGSATPSLESMNNANLKSYTLLKLPDRTGGAQLPTMRVLDMRRQASIGGLSHPLRTAIANRLESGEQSLLFLNRRGYAPVLMCPECGWIAPCRRCDAHMTLHRDVRVPREGRSSASCARGTHPSLDVAGSREGPLHRDVRVPSSFETTKSPLLRCHHCGAESAVPVNCPVCARGHLRPVGEGTERVEIELVKLFPKAKVVRIDRDTTRRRGALEKKLEDIHAGDADILVGTQMLSKGHDFPNVTLVGVLNADQGLYNADFRASERLFQQIMQVSGRAGRARKAGEVLIQTHYPSHPLFAALSRHDYDAFAEFALAERRESSFPPFTFLALLRAESTRSNSALTFLSAARTLGSEIADPNEVVLMDPVPAPMERRAGRYRAHLLVQSQRRSALHGFLSRWLARLNAESVKSVRWSLDVDPMDLY